MTSKEEKKASKESCRTQLCEIADGSPRFYVLGMLAVGLTVAASGAATLAGLAKINPQIVGIIAAIPGILTFGASTLRLNERAAWHVTRKEMIAGLRRRLLYELPLNPTADNIAAISEAWTGEEHKLHEEFTRKLLSGELLSAKKKKS